MSRSKISLAIIIVLVSISMIAVVSKTDTSVKTLQLNLQTKDQQLKIFEAQKEAINQELEKAKGDSRKLKELEQKNQELQKAVEDAQARKAEKLRLAQLEAKNVAVASPETPTTQVSGSKLDWLKASGIPEAEWTYVDYIVQKEATWNPHALNSSSGACSLAQALPCSKIPGDWTDPVNALKWQYQYVLGRYGSYQQAYNFWLQNSWY